MKTIIIVLSCLYYLNVIRTSVRTFPGWNCPELACEKLTQFRSSLPALTQNKNGPGSTRKMDVLTYSYFETCWERLSENMCARQSRKVISKWYMINMLLLTLQLSNLLFLLSFSTHRHMSMTSRAILSNSFEKQRTKNHPQYLTGLLRALFPRTSISK